MLGSGGDPCHFWRPARIGVTVEIRGGCDSSWSGCCQLQEPMLWPPTTPYWPTFLGSFPVRACSLHTANDQFLIGMPARQTIPGPKVAPRQENHSYGLHMTPTEAGYTSRVQPPSDHLGLLHPSHISRLRLSDPTAPREWREICDAVGPIFHSVAVADKLPVITTHYALPSPYAERECESTRPGCRAVRIRFGARRSHRRLI